MHYESKKEHLAAPLYGARRDTVLCQFCYKQTKNKERAENSQIFADRFGLLSTLT